MTDTEETQTPTPLFHYEGGLYCLSESLNFPHGSSDQTNALLNAIAHALLGGLRESLDYAAQHPAPVPEPVPSEPRIEEDDIRP